MKFTFANPTLPSGGVVVAFALEGSKLTASAKALDAANGRAISRAVKVSRFEGKKGQHLTLLSPGNGALDRVVLIGLGMAKDVDTGRMQDAGGAAYAALGTVAERADVLVDAVTKRGLAAADAAAAFAYGMQLRSYRFDKYRTREKPEQKPTLRAARLCCEDAARARRLYKTEGQLADGVFLTRDLVSEPPNVLYPVEFARRARAELRKLGVKVTVMGESQLEKLGMGALLGVGQGSVRQSQVVIMEWNGAPRASAKPIAFIGKGVCFDTGGISIKPAAGMEDMKWDMGGAGVVTGLMKALAGRKAKVNVIGAIGLVENMPGGNAQRPSDIVTSMSGQTIEVLNTDAEGRLVLADVLHYVNDRFKPEFMVDLATLTGAIIISLGDQHAGLFSNNDELSERLHAAGNAVGEKVWRLPLAAEYDKMIDCDVADMKNIGGRGAGSITAAQFLQRFVGDTPWAHLDIAGVTWSKTDSPLVPKGGTGFGVRLLERLVADHYEGK